MRILAIETSCDETAIAVINGEGTLETGVSFGVHSNIVHSQVELHAEYGGVYPTIAKREHSRNLVPVLEKALAGTPKTEASGLEIPEEQIQATLEREPELAKALINFLHDNPETPDIDAIAVTYGPGLEPALWVGINLARVLASVWEKPLIPINHMEGHFVSALLKQEDTQYAIRTTHFPILALLVSGGHTELVLSRLPAQAGDWLNYEIIGSTRDDAAGEAFDKAARILGLAYPGGPEIARKASEYVPSDTAFAPLPRPMLDSDDYDFSFSGLKTAVRYRAEEIGTLDEKTVRAFAYEFQEAATDVLVAKTLRAAREHATPTIAVGGGVSANERLREKLTEQAQSELPETDIRFAPREFTGDNALMIAVAAYLRQTYSPKVVRPEDVSAVSTAALA